MRHITLLDTFVRSLLHDETVKYILTPLAIAKILDLIHNLR